MSGSILTNTDGVVGKDPRYTVELSKTGDTDGRTEVVNEDGESRSRGLEESVVSNSVKNRSHSMFADSEVHVLSGIRFIEASTEVSTIVDVVTSRSVKISGSRNVLRDGSGNVLDGLVSGDTGSLGTRLKRGDGLAEFLSGGNIVLYGIGELLGEFGVGLSPGSVGLLPLVVSGGVLALNTIKEFSGSLRYEPLLLRKAEFGASSINVRNTGLSVGSVGSSTSSTPFPMMVLHLMNLGFPLLDALAAAMVASTVSRSCPSIS